MKNILILFFCILPNLLYSQEFSFDEELKLANHLINSNNNKEAIYHLEKILTKFDSNPGNSDTLNFLLGYAYYQQKEFAKSNNYLLKVSEKSASYNKARFTSIYNYLYTQQYSEADKTLDLFKPKSSLLSEYQAMQSAGLSLLKKKYDVYPELSKKFTYNHFSIQKEQNELDSYYKYLLDFKPKSMALAGLFSTVVPGTGKMYAGKVGEGMSAFLIVSILGAITAENYFKNGINDFKTITFGSLLSVFYLGNIYGSIVSVKVYREEFYKTYERKILVNIHIPLRNIFY